MNAPSIPYRVVATALSAAWLLTACSGGSRTLPAISSASSANISPAAVSAAHPFAGANAKSKIAIKPASLALLGIGSNSAQSVTISEKKYTGKFSEKSTCNDVATAKPASGNGPSLTVTLTGKKAGSCTITFSDKSKNAATLSVSDTTTSMALSSASISPGSASMTIVLTSVNGKKPAKGLQTSVTVNLSGCSRGCKVAAPQSPPGNDVYGVTIFDAAGGSGNQLATGTVTAKIVEAKANTVTATLAKIPVYLQFGTVPSGTAGTSFATPLPLSVQDADRNTIAGNYSTPVTVSDSDTTPIAEGSSLEAGNGTASRSLQLNSSRHKPVLLYGGLAIAPVTLTASATGVATNATTSFAASIGSVAYDGPQDGSTPEIDLYSTVFNAPGNSGSFTLSQAGWSESPFNNGFTYALGGANNNCTSFSITPPSSSATTNFIITVGASPVGGTCMLTATGATAGSTVHVTLTYTSTGIGVYGRRPR